MKLDDQLYQRYLEELQALENFKHVYNGNSAALKMVMEDPHTRHLVETLAFFSARNRLHGERTILNLYRRLFRQYFPFLWSPIPAMGVIQLLPLKDLQETIECRSGTEIYLQTQEKCAYFQTTKEMRVLPVQLGRCHFDAKEKGETCFTMHFSAPVSMDVKIGSFRLYIHHLNHFPSSLSLSFALKEHLKKVEVHYDVSEREPDHGTPCQIDFAPPSQSLFNHPIETLRSKLNFPEQELFFDVQVPPHTKKWRTFSLTFYLGSNWPKIFSLTSHSFLPFVVPIINLQKKKAEIIHCDSTKDHYPILYPNNEDGYALHSLLGVYAIDKHKLFPLKPGVLTHDSDSYEIEATFEEKKSPEYRLLLNLPGTFQSPKLVTVEAFWYQPWFDGLEKEFKTIIANQVIRQITPQILGSLSSPEEQAYLYDISFLTRLLSLKNQTSLDLGSLLFLMNTLKRHSRGYFKEIPPSITDLKVNQRNRAFSSTASQEYHFVLEKLDDKNRHLALLYFSYVKQFLDLWLPNIELIITLSAPQLSDPLIIKAGTFS